MKNKRNLIILVSIIALVLIIFLISFNKKMETYEVAFVIDEGTIISTQKVNEGEKVVKPTDPEKEGYVFIEWTYQDRIYDFSQKVTSNLELKAKWIEIQEEVETFSIKFDSDSGTTISNQIVEKGNKVKKPEEPTKEGYIFKKWTLNGQEYDFETEVTGDFELKAEWEKVNTKSNNANNKNDSNNNNNNSDAQEETDNLLVEAPTLSTPAGGKGFAQLSIVYEGPYVDGTSEISGYELYEKNGSQYTLIHTSETTFKTDVTVDVGESKTYVARVYAYNKSNVKVYSNYSNEKVINNPIPETPTLSTPAGGPGFAQLSIVYTGEYAGDTSQISGYELYEKNGSQYILVHTSETTFKTDVTVNEGESKTYVARVYAYNKSNVKIYSNYSNEVVIDW